MSTAATKTILGKIVFTLWEGESPMLTDDRNFLAHERRTQLLQIAAGDRVARLVPHRPGGGLRGRVAGVLVALAVRLSPSGVLALEPAICAARRAAGLPALPAGPQSRRERRQHWTGDQPGSV